MFKSENILCNLVRIWLEQYQLLFYITNLQPMGSHHATLNFKDSHDWVITKKKEKRKKSLMGEKEEKSFSHFQVASSTEKRWMNLLQFLVCEKSEPKRELLQKFAYYHSTSISYCYVAICLHEIHKTLNFVKEESFKILILTSFCRDPTDINPLLILIQDLCIFFQVISMT